MNKVGLALVSSRSNIAESFVNTVSRNAVAHTKPSENNLDQIL